MKKNYTLKLKNGDTTRLNDEQYAKLAKCLTQSKDKIPNFVSISDKLIRTDYIASITADAW